MLLDMYHVGFFLLATLVASGNASSAATILDSWTSQELWVDSSTYTEKDNIRLNVSGDSYNSSLIVIQPEYMNNDYVFKYYQTYNTSLTITNVTITDYQYMQHTFDNHDWRLIYNVNSQNNTLTLNTVY